MATKTPTCPVCGKPVLTSQPFKEYNKKKYHIACYRKMQQEVFETEYVKEVANKSEKDELYNYINKIFNTKEVDPHFPRFYEM